MGLIIMFATIFCLAVMAFVAETTITVITRVVQLIWLIIRLTKE